MCNCLQIKNFQINVKIIFLNNNLEEIYMDQLKGFIKLNQKKVCKLVKSLYGFKQAPK